MNLMSLSTQPKCLLVNQPLSDYLRTSSLKWLSSENGGEKAWKRSAGRKIQRMAKETVSIKKSKTSDEEWSGTRFSGRDFIRFRRK